MAACIVCGLAQENPDEYSFELKVFWGFNPHTGTTTASVTIHTGRCYKLVEQIVKALSPDTLIEWEPLGKHEP